MRCFDLSDNFNINDDMDNETVETIIMTDENGEDVEFVIVDQVTMDGNNYILVVESEYIDDVDAEAEILKEVSQEGEDSVYEVIEDDEEFERVAELFSDNDEYDIEV